MKHKKRGAALITAAVLALVALFGMTACQNNAGGTPKPKFAVTFSVEGDAPRPNYCRRVDFF